MTTFAFCFTTFLELCQIRLGNPNAKLWEYKSRTNHMVKAQPVTQLSASRYNLFQTTTNHLLSKLSTAITTTTHVPKHTKIHRILRKLT